VRVSAKGEYALTALLDLALHAGDGLQPIQEIAARQGIPPRYLEQVLLELKRAGFLEARRGSAGGYRLSQPPDRVTVGAVLRAIDGSVGIGAVTPRGGGRARGEHAGDLGRLWQEVSEAVSAVVDRVTIEDLRQRVLARRGDARPMYHI